MKISLCAVGLVAGLATVCAGGMANAETLRQVVKPGQWSVDVTTVTTKAHFNTLGICLTAEGTWYNTTQASGSGVGSGKWLVTGNTVLWRGNMLGSLSDSAVLNVSSPSAMSGYLMQWIKDGTDTTNTAIENVYATSTWTFVGDRCGPKF